ncbi:endoribonuclease YbeY [Alphaproteobacteria bacterium]|nr:endoribonuclease YbeY [Alphaproteobacteria bacterium]
MSLDNSQILIRVADKRWREEVPLLRPLIRASVNAAWEGEAAREVSVLLTGDAQVRELNAAWRGIDKPTNVLSFPAEEPDSAGDIALAFETVRREALRARQPVGRRLARLLVHGAFHLRGLDHQTDAEAAVMEARERAAMKQLNALKIWDKTP